MIAELSDRGLNPLPRVIDRHAFLRSGLSPLTFEITLVEIV
jgi:hypothetical protein